MSLHERFMNYIRREYLRTGVWPHITYLQYIEKIKEKS